MGVVAQIKDLDSAACFFAALLTVFLRGPRKIKRSGILWGKGETTERGEKWPTWNKGHFEHSAVRFDAIRGAVIEKADFD